MTARYVIFILVIDISFLFCQNTCKIYLEFMAKFGFFWPTAYHMYENDQDVASPREARIVRWRTEYLGHNRSLCQFYFDNVDFIYCFVKIPVRFTQFMA